MIDSLRKKARIVFRRMRVGANLHRNDALGALHRAWGYVHATQLAGDYYEFGVHGGWSMVNSWFSYRYFRRRLAQGRALPFQRRGTVAAFLAHRPLFHGFDTFAGMPDNDEGEDTLAPGSFWCDLDIVTGDCARAGLRSPELRLVPGLFADTAAQVGLRPAAIVHLDCDLYASTRDALRAVSPCLVQGTVVLCDDYNLFRADQGRGQRRAVAEFSAVGGIRLEPWFAYGPAAQAFLCHVDHPEGG
ncbi:TylF/MycF/NovP-related O-methyltransferase [Magnetospirillum sp. 64-120]|uniref:TylF/MycF/NovP-related O-methyltransferase n=1 Tax=Magnetospirillum sp. 64-120 TaxID=1895778 RepID=UPI00092680C8|nr:TylF/MycF/NovP-related O-methyltransferase [Magnetospirillum sp. 64-120]OJX67161.1 MAG: methyltransferase [Magnetospirillum sp. 64-120]